MSEQRQRSEWLTGPVLVVGAGLLGTSVGLACRRSGLEVLLSDLAVEHVRTASGMGAGRALADGDAPQLVVVAVPPDHLGAAVAAALEAHPEAVVTDVGSVKASVVAAVEPVPRPTTMPGCTSWAAARPTASLGSGACMKSAFFGTGIIRVSCERA